ncbi:hypothetical protein J2755_000300 [Methanohalophilus levihalophilus]|uniref:hypothetical protein n=1 Tax=Methanohalophilus levihalophilus TaxID=1431282 RepID=UPI001AE2C5D5|nr:hypothetical protein [Methanohalophilus levihalophilus]MBP2029380.1 hypothetical protein [Methanohalophilus levihalophilus]
MATTLLLLASIWSAYKYWLLNFRIVRTNRKSIEQLLFAVSFVIVSEHIRFNSIVGNVFDYLMFLILLYIVLAGTYLTAKGLDSLDLSQDLYCWGLRVLGLILILAGIMITTSGHMMVLLAPEGMVKHIVWIFGICMILLGVFSNYRSTRRHGIFVYMR